MIWERKSKYFANSGCGRYRVSVTRHDEDYKYSAWVISGSKCLGVFDNSSAAKLVCEQHWSRSNG